MYLLSSLRQPWHLPVLLSKGRFRFLSWVFAPENKNYVKWIKFRKIFVTQKGSNRVTTNVEITKLLIFHKAISNICHFPIFPNIVTNSICSNHDAKHFQAVNQNFSYSFHINKDLLPRRFRGPPLGFLLENLLGRLQRHWHHPHPHCRQCLLFWLLVWPSFFWTSIRFYRLCNFIFEKARAAQKWKWFCFVDIRKSPKNSSKCQKAKA